MKILLKIFKNLQNNTFFQNAKKKTYLRKKIYWNDYKKYERSALIGDIRESVEGSNQPLTLSTDDSSRKNDY